MSKYYKPEAVEKLIDNFINAMVGREELVDLFLSEQSTIEVNEETLKGCDKVDKRFSDEDELKFYYVDSIDDYWIGRRLDNFYYAKWNGKLGFVWSASRYLPWGEHVVAPDTLWKEHTYPSEPREIPFTEWIVGFMKKRTSEDAISREDAIKAYNEAVDELVKAEMEEFNLGDYTECSFNTTQLKLIARKIEDAPSVIPKPKEGRSRR